MQMVSVGILGEYVARIFQEVKGRPLYVVSDSVNVQAVEPHIAKAVIFPPEEPEAEYERATRKANRL